MRPLSLPYITMIVFIAVSLPILWIVQMHERQETDRTNYYLSIRVEDVSYSNIAAHVQKVENDYSVPAEWVIPKIKMAISEHPEGTLFFYNTSIEQWRNLGGEMGYAILHDRRIVWSQRLKIS